MILFRCTSKLRKEIGVKPKELFEPDETIRPVYCWYAELVRIGHSKHLLFMHEKTLYPFVAFDLKRSEIRGIDQVFRLELREMLFSEGVGSAVIEKVLADAVDFKIGKASHRSFVGSLTEFARHTRWYFEDFPMKAQGNEIGTSKRLSRMPMYGKVVKNAFPYDLFGEFLREQYGYKGQLEGTHW